MKNSKFEGKIKEQAQAIAQEHQKTEEVRKQLNFQKDEQ